MKKASFLLYAVSALIFPGVATAKVNLTGTSAVPSAVRKAGYLQNTFSVSSFNGRSFDRTDSRKTGYKFYSYNLFFSKRNFSNTVLPSGILEARGGNASIVSAACSDKPCTSFVGTAFGGGAYVEAEIAYNPANIDLRTGWPAVWMLTIESITRSRSFNWAGQEPGYNHSVEVDILEHHLGPSVHGYGVAVHDWFGRYDQSCPGMHYCRYTSGGAVALPPEIDFQKFHKVGMLWVPATRRSRGSVRFFFDGNAVGPTTTWTRYDPLTARPPVSRDTPWAWGVIDRSHMILILGAGSSTSIKIKSVNVWQRSATENIVR